MYRHLIFLMWVGLVQSVEDPTRKKGLILPWLRDLLMHVCLSLNRDFVLFCFVFSFFFSPASRICLKCPSTWIFILLFSGHKPLELSYMFSLDKHMDP